MMRLYQKTTDALLFLSRSGFAAPTVKHVDKTNVQARTRGLGSMRLMRPVYVRASEWRALKLNQVGDIHGHLFHLRVVEGLDVFQSTVVV